MLQIIVLGQVPGTNLHLSFTGVLVVGLIAGIGALGYIHRTDIHRLKAKFVKPKTA